MKKIILFAAICFGMWSYFQKEPQQSLAVTLQQPVLGGKPIQRDYAPAAHTESRFQCDGRQYCSQMTSTEFPING